MLRSISIRSRLILLVTVPLLVLVSVSITALVEISLQHEGVNTLYNDRVEPLREIKITSDMYSINIVTLLHKYRGEMITPQELETGIREAQATAAEQWKLYKNTSLNAREAELVRQAEQQFVQSDKAVDVFLQTAANHELRALTRTEFMQALYTAFDPLTSELTELINLQLEESAQYVQQSEQAYYQIEYTLAIVCGVVIIALLLFGTLAYRSISHPVQALVDDLHFISERSDLRRRIKVEGDDELTRLAKTQNQMLERFHEILRHLSDAVQHSTVASEEMSVIASQVSQTVSRQSDQVISVTSSITEMAGAVREVANSAAETAHHATIANDQTLTGQQQIRDNVASISRLSECVERSDDIVNRLHQQSSSISEVLTVIRSIAERTNLLALNAAIESARAGEAGRGFAVVADEVRALAQNTQKATGSIGEIIEVLQASSMEAVGILKEARARAVESVNTTEVTGQLLQEIASAVDRINAMNLQVSAATEQQAAVSDEIQRTVVLFRQALDDVSENANNSAIASTEIARLASNLQQQVAVFVI